LLSPLQHHTKQPPGNPNHQDLIEEDAAAFLDKMIDSPSTQFYMCGLKRMYTSVIEVLERLGEERRVDIHDVIAKLKKEHRWHIETA